LFGPTRAGAKVFGAQTARGMALLGSISERHFLEAPVPILAVNHDDDRD
jgi:hypothetical protein